MDKTRFHFTIKLQNKQKVWGGKEVKWVKSFLRVLGDLSSIPRPTLNRRTGEVEAAGFLGLASEPAYLVSSRVSIQTHRRTALEDPQAG